MREPTAGDLTERIQFRRAAETDDGYGSVLVWADYGTPLWASFLPVSDAERWSAGQLNATTMARFQVRWSAFTDGLNAKDRLVYDGREYEIIGVKDIVLRRWREVTAVAGAD